MMQLMVAMDIYDMFSILKAMKVYDSYTIGTFYQLLYNDLPHRTPHERICMLAKLSGQSVADIAHLLDEAMGLMDFSDEDELLDELAIYRGPRG